MAALDLHRSMGSLLAISTANTIREPSRTHWATCMQIDFHHGVTYIVARLAGFDHSAASTIAYSAQYVDDATNAGLIYFDNGAVFEHFSSAHKLLDYRNFRQLAHHQVWIPFHFLPGNGGLPAGQSPEEPLTNKLICRPNSYVAQDMLVECIHQRHTPHSLHRLGICHACVCRHLVPSRLYGN